MKDKLRMNNPMKLTTAIALLMLFSIPSLQSTFAHGGRRLDVVVIDGKIYAQGYNNGTDDGAGLVRPHLNAIHTHWSSTTDAATLPGFDVTFGDSFEALDGSVQQYGYDNQAQLLDGFGLTLELIGAGKWSAPATTSFMEEALGSGEVIEVDFGGATLSTNDLGSGTPLTFDLVTNWSTPGRTDRDPEYFFDQLSVDRNDALYYLQWRISSDNPAIEASGPVSTIFSPPMKFHHNAVALESALGVTIASVPEPTAAFVVLLGVAGLAVKRRRSSI